MELTFKHLCRTGFALLIAGSAMSCASKSDGGSSGGSSTGSTLTVPSSPSTDTSGATGDYFAGQEGASAVLTIDGATASQQISRLSQYVGTHPLNSPTNFRIYVDLNDETGNGAWGGTVQIGYYDNGQLNIGQFTSDNPSGSSTVRVSYKNWYTGISNAAFNRWFTPTSGGAQVFHGFFQDSLGSIVIVIDNSDTTDLGDGLGTSTVSGSVYFKNFRTAPAPQFMDTNYDGVMDGEMCWFLLSPSPYECGTFKNSSGQVSTTSAVYPSSSDGYTRLGTFTALKRSTAFHN